LELGLVYLDLGHDVIDKIGELYEYYNFANWSMDWFGLDWEIQGLKVGLKKLQVIAGLRNFSMCETAWKT
jgi:hypothetical protein